MTNEFNLDLGNVATVATALVGADFNLASTVAVDLSSEFKQGLGSKVSIPVPGATPSHVKGIGDRTTPLVSDDIVEQTIDVTLTDHVYSLTTLSEADMSLNITDFSRQVLRPQARAISTAVESRVAAAISATPTHASVVYDKTKPAQAFTAARARLRANGVPDDARLVAAVGVDVYADLMNAPVGQGFDPESTRERKVVRDFDVIESTRLDPKDAVFYIPNAFALVARAPQVPRGASAGESIVTPANDTNNGRRFAARLLLDYDPVHAVDRVLTSSFIAVQALPLPVDNGDGTVTLVENGGAVRVRGASA